MMAAIPGEMLSRYRLVEKIGAGGMGVVYRAHDTRLKRDVALKVLAPHLTSDPQLRRRFLREAQAAAAVTHSNIATIHEIDEADGVTFIVMELIDGRPLRALIKDGPLPIGDAVRIATELAEGLARAHRAGIVHRDLKPDNVMIGSDRHVKVLDFGLARLIEDHDLALRAAADGAGVSQEPTATSDDVTRRGQLVGTPAYMSPEQARGERADERSDIFSFGITLYEMLSGRRPFTGRNRIETMAGILQTRPVPVTTINNAIPPRLLEILDRCLEKDPERRYQNGAELADDLRDLRDNLPTQDRKERTPDPRPSPAKTAAIMGIALAVMVAALLIGVGMWRAQRQQFSPPGATEPARGVAVLPFAYEGPEEKAHLKSLIPILLIEKMRRAGGLRVAPFDYSRKYAADGDAAVVARELGVERVIGGRLTIDDETFGLAAWIARAGDGAEAAAGDPRMIDTQGGQVATVFDTAGGLALDLKRALGVVAVEESDEQRVDPAAMELYLQGLAYVEGWDFKKNYVLAAEMARAAIAIAPGFAEAHALLSRALRVEYVQSKDPALIPPALEAAQSAVALAPGLPEGHAALGSINIWRGRSAEAARAFEEGMRLAPADDALIGSFARVYARLGRDEEAEAMYRRGIELRPSYWAHYNAFGAFLLRRGRLDEAKAQFRKVIELRPGSDTGYSNLAAVHILAGEHAEAEPLLRAALNIEPAHNTRNNLGVVYYATDRFEDAAREWQAIADAGVERVMYLSNLGDAYRQLGREEEATRAYRRAVELGREQLEIDTENTDARAMYSIALAGSGDCVESRVNADRALKGEPGNPTLCYYAAVAAAICNDRAAAVPRTRCAIEGGIKVDVMTNPDLEPLLDDPSLRTLLD